MKQIPNAKGEFAKNIELRKLVSSTRAETLEQKLRFLQQAMFAERESFPNEAVIHMLAVLHSDNCSDRGQHLT